MKYNHLNIFCLLLLTVACSAFVGIKLHGGESKHNRKPTLTVYKDPQITAFFNRETGWIAADGALTVPLDNGKVLWLFGDSFTNDYNHATGTVPCLFNVRSCGLLQPFNNWDWHATETILNDKKGTLFNSDPTPNHFNWPAEGVAIGDTAYIYCINLKNVSTGMGFETLGNNSFAKISLNNMKVAGYHQLQDLDGISFGIGFVKDAAAGYVYAYGDKGKAFGKDYLYVARFPISNPNAAWAFWDGKDWVADVKKASRVGLLGAVSPNVSKVKDKYLLLTTDLSVGCDMGKSIYAQVSDKLTGPFSEKKLLYTIDDTVKGHYPFFYLPVAHPEYINGNDELLITYSINGYGTCLPACSNNQYNPNFYRPRGIRVPLKLIDPQL